MGELIIAKNGGSGGSGGIDISSATVTLASGTLTYDGSVKTKGVSSVVVDGNTLVEGMDYVVLNNSAANAGGYTLYVVGIGNYDGEKGVSWNIGKAQGSISVNPSSLSIIGAGNTDTATLTIVGDGTVSVSTSASSVATATRSRNVVTVTSVGNGTATITITLAAGTNYIGGSATINVSSIVPSATLSDNTPVQIQVAAQNGTASTLWSVGDKTAPITIGAVGDGFTGAIACAFILGFNHNSDIEDTGIHFQFGKTTNGTDIAFVDSTYSNPSSGARFYMADTSYVWNLSKMRSVICPAFLTALPTEWRNVISSCIKYTAEEFYLNASFASNNDKIWLLSEYEVFGSTTYADSKESNYQVQYDYYKNGNNKLKYKHNDTSTKCNWWLRSPRSNSSGSYCQVNSGGAINSANCSYSYGFAPGFKIT